MTISPFIQAVKNTIDAEIDIMQDVTDLVHTGELEMGKRVRLALWIISEYTANYGTMDDPSSHT